MMSLKRSMTSRTSKKKGQPSGYMIVARTALVAEKRRLERQIGDPFDQQLSLKLDRVLEAIHLLRES